MTLEETLNKLIRDSVNLILGSPGFAIKAKQDAPRPIGSYADVDFLNDVHLGWEEHNLTNDTETPDIIESIVGLRSITMSIGFYRTGAKDKARKVRTGFVRQSVQDLFLAADIGLTSRSEVRDIDEAFEDGYEERSQFDIVLNAVGSDSDIIRAIETVNIAGEFQSRGLTYNLDIEV